MKILALGHSCYLLEMLPAAGGRPVRLLADPWLSDHLIGDLLGRFPRVRLEPADMAPLDGIWISHSHTDHLDPYSLMRLYAGIEPAPCLLLPQSLAFLEDLFRDHLGAVDITYLRDFEPISFRGLELMAFFNPETNPTNEDDVMVLTVDNGLETFVCESDAVLPFDDCGVRETLGELLARPDREGVAFLTIKNEGEATMSMVSARDREDRQARVGKSLELTYEEIYRTYAPVDEDIEGSVDPWQNPRLVRLIAGQGIGFPQQTSPQWNRVLFPIRLEDRVRMEREAAEQLGLAHSIVEFVPGQMHLVEGGCLAAREDCPWLELLDREEERRFDPSLELYDDFPVAPLRSEERPREIQAARLLTCLNLRFLPYLIGSRRPPVEHLLAANGGEYRIRLRFGTETEHEDRDYRISFMELCFDEVAAEGEPDEFYWANDVEDVLEGKSDEFSTFCRHPLGGRAQRFWLSLGLPYLNNDLIEKKLRYQFERAARGESLEEWVLSFHRT